MNRRKCPSCCTIINNLCTEQKIHKEDHMCMGIYFDKYILIYVDFSRILNVILRFHELSTDFLENGITFTLSNSERATERIKSYRWS